MAVNQESSNNNLRPVTHVIFDMDGLLLDTETCWTQAANSISNPFGKSFTWRHKAVVMGRPPREAAKYVIDDLELPLTPERFVKHVDEYIENAMKDVKMMPGVKRLVKHLHQNKIPMAIATGSNLRQFYKKTEHYGDFFKLGNYFSHVVTSDDPEVKQGKPAPDCFLVAANRFQSKGFENPKEMYNVLVFEDSPQGVAAAINAGMQCVMVPDPRVDEAVKAKATLAIRSMYYFNPSLFSLASFEDNKFGCKSP